MDHHRGRCCHPRPEPGHWRRPRTQLREKRASSTATEPPPTRRSFVHHRDFEDVAPFIVVHHEHTNVVSQPDLSGSTHRSLPQTDSATMTAQDVSATPALSPNATKSWEASRSQSSFYRSAKIRPCSSQAWEESTVPPVPEASQDRVFTPSPPALCDTSTTATAPSTTNTGPLRLAFHPAPMRMTLPLHGHGDTVLRHRLLQGTPS